jgi:hypothetical protein
MTTTKTKRATNRREMDEAKAASVAHCLKANLPPGETDITKSKTWNVHAPFAMYSHILGCINDGRSHIPCPCICGHEVKTKRSTLRDSTEMQWRCACWRFFDHAASGILVED